MKTVMEILFISLLVTVSVVKGDYGPITQPFTFYHPLQVDYVHKHKYQSFVQNIHSSESSSSLKKIHAVQGLENIQVGFENAQQPATFRSSSGSLLDQTKGLIQDAETIFKALENNTQAQIIFSYAFEPSDCLANADDAIELMEKSTNILVKNGPEIIYLDAIVSSLKDETNVTKLILASAKMIKIFDILLPRLSSKSTQLCITSPEQSVKDFKLLAHAMVDIKNNRHIETDQISRQLLESTSKIMSKVANFLKSLNKILSPEKICIPGKKKSSLVYASIENIMESLASLFDVLGFPEKTEDIRKQGDFVNKIVVSLYMLPYWQNLQLNLFQDAFSDIDELNATLECGEDDSYDNLALTLEDLAEIVQSVGVDALSEVLEIDLSFIEDA